jgi:hypothetical protein
MNQNEIRDRLLELARVRLKNRFGAFEQFRFTLDGLVEGSAILARASLLPAAWIAGFRLGLGEAAKQIDAHLLRIIDEWAQREAPAREIPALEGVQPLAAEPQAETIKAAPVVTESASNAPVVPFKKAALIAAHVHEWPSIERDIADANTNGLAAAAKAGARGWKEDAALVWARANGKLISAAKPANSLAQAMHNLGTLPHRKHTIQG